MNNYPAYKNGTFCQIKDLTVSILDFGFIHSDATYDVMSVQNGVVKDFDEHVNRFMDNCNFWGLNTPNDFHIKETIMELVNTSPTKDLLVWICVTRGTPTTGNPRDLGSCEQNFFAYTKPYYGFNPTNTATVCLAKQRRNTAINQRRKNFAWNDLTIAQFEANSRGFDTAILLDENGFVTEGPGFNVGLIRGEHIIAPAKNCLLGVTMSKVKEMAGDMFHYYNVTPETFKSADAMFLTSTAGGVIRVSTFEETNYSDNRILSWLQNNI
jgi:branched-chain amino acid aminotransferase